MPGKYTDGQDSPNKMEKKGKSMGYGIVIVILALVLGIIFFQFYKKKQEERRQEEERQRRIAEEEERQRQLKLEEEARKAARKAEIEAGKELYHYLNQSMKTMFHHYCKGNWEEMETLGSPNLQDRSAAGRCIEKLSSGNRKIMQRFFSCIEVDDSYAGTGNVTDPEGLKKFFERMMLPFFPVYYNEFSNGPRYISFLNQKILKLYTQLSGKRFRLGYKNRYPNGQVAFEWTDDIYRVYRFDGKKLCDASFAEGKVKNGYALIKQSEDQDWTVYLSGDWKDGVLTREDTQYRYKKNIDL